MMVRQYVFVHDLQELKGYLLYDFDSTTATRVYLDLPRVTLSRHLQNTLAFPSLHLPLPHTPLFLPPHLPPHLGPLSFV
jgi:hypothetical protein